MPKCKICKKPFEAYIMERATLPVIDKQPFDVVKFFCPHCQSLQHLLSAPPQLEAQGVPAGQGVLMA